MLVKGSAVLRRMQLDFEIEKEKITEVMRIHHQTTLILLSFQNSLFLP
jgi:hypothetical protein